MIHMKERIIEALEANALGNIKKHQANVEIYLTNPVGIGEHPDVMQAIEDEINMISKYHEQLEVIQNYLKD